MTSKKSLFAQFNLSCLLEGVVRCESTIFMMGEYGQEVDTITGQLTTVTGHEFYLTFGKDVRIKVMNSYTITHGIV